MKEDVCTATDSSAQSGASQPLCERSVGQTEISILFYCPAALQRVALFFLFVFVCVCANRHLFYCIYDVFLDPGDQSDGNIREGTLYS